MRYTYYARVLPSLIALLLVLCLGAPAIWAQSGAGSGVTDRSWKAIPSERSWLEDFVTESLLSEVMVVLVCALGAGLAVAGLEALDARRERKRDDAARLHARIAGAIQRDRLLKNLAVTPIVHLPLWGMSGPTVEVRGNVPTAWTATPSYALSNWKLAGAVLRITSRIASQSPRR